MKSGLGYFAYQKYLCEKTRVYIIPDWSSPTQLDQETTYLCLSFLYHSYSYVYVYYLVYPNYYLTIVTLSFPLIIPQKIIGMFWIQSYLNTIVFVLVSYRTLVFSTGIWYLELDCIRLQQPQDVKIWWRQLCLIPRDKDYDYYT